MIADRQHIIKHIYKPIQLLGKPLFILGYICIFMCLKFQRLLFLHFKSRNKHPKPSVSKQINSTPFRPSPRLKSLLKWLYLRTTKSKQQLIHLKVSLYTITASCISITNNHLNTIQQFLPALSNKVSSSFKCIASFPLIIHRQFQRLHVPHFRLPTPKITIRIHYLKASLLIILLLSAHQFYEVIIKDLPHPEQLLTQTPPVTTKVFDRNHHLLYQFYQDENRTLVPLSQIPPEVIFATLAIEDAEFYDHPGFSVRGIMRALKINLTKDDLQGGSTITQQLIKNTLLTPERTFTRKVKELVLALAVESFYTKDEILSMYLNQVSYGGTSYGIQAASQAYFGKDASQLNLAEAALLAGLPASPTTYSPFGSNPQYSIDRQHQVLTRMHQEGYISADLEAQAKAYPLSFIDPTTNITAPHFVMYVKDELINKYTESQVNQGGFEVVTTLDRDIQELAEYAINQELQTLSKLNITNAAAIVTDPKTGEILAMVGSQNYFDTANDGQVNVVTRPRQPGSSIKPINYAYALEHGYTPSTIIEDTPITYSIPGSPPYSPKNYDGQFHGRVTLRQALANSYNIPAVKTLEKFGVNNMVTIGQQMGISTWDDPSRFGLALTLGGGEVTLKDMAIVYGTFANMGLNVPARSIRSLTDVTGKSYPQEPCTIIASARNIPKTAHAAQDCSHQVLSPKTAFQISDILSDNQARSQAFGLNSVLNIDGHQVAVKTGTTNSMRDNWTIGYTSDYVVGVWVGNNDNTPMSYVASGITGASPIWHTIMTALLKDQPAHRFPIPDQLIEVEICPQTGTLTCPACPNPRKEYFTKGTQPTISCTPESFTPPPKST